MDNLDSTLASLGFSQKEIKIYLALLELGTASYTDLAKKTGIKRTSLYAMVDKLIERGVVHPEVDTKKLTPLAPDRLFATLQSKVLQFHKLIPALADLGKDKGALSKVKFYSGVDGIKEAYLEEENAKTAKADRFVLVVSDTKTWNGFWNEHDKDFSHTYLTGLKRSGYHQQAFFSGGPDGKLNKKFVPEYNMKIHYLPEDYNYEFDMEVRPSQIIISDLKAEQPYAIKIISSELARAMANFFNYAWGKD